MGQHKVPFLIKVLGIVIHSVLVDTQLTALQPTCSSCLVQFRHGEMGAGMKSLGTSFGSLTRNGINLKRERVQNHQWRPSMTRHSWSIPKFSSISWCRRPNLCSWGNDFIVLEDSSHLNVCRSNDWQSVKKPEHHPKPVFFCHEFFSLIPFFRKMARNVNLQSFQLEPSCHPLIRTDTMAELKKEWR